MFGSQLVWYELVLRASAVYWFLFLVFRLLLRRDSGSITLADVLFLVLLGDASQNAMIGDSTSITDAAIVVSTLAGWNTLLDWLAFRSALARRLLQPRPLALVRNGVIDRRHMRREFLTVDELHAKMREHGVDSLSDVKLATMESDGTISIVKRQGIDSTG
ncbi:MAG: DUF421 domain-containing protein [Burkholderiales bacterium]|nr:DUF421 domain-containing protein [Burkholderiales bacterium]